MILQKLQKLLKQQQILQIHHLLQMIIVMMVIVHQRTSDIDRIIDNNTIKLYTELKTKN